jgi:hypothetical protein
VTRLRWVFFALVANFLLAAAESAAAAWNVDLDNSTVLLIGSTFADNASNGLAPAGVFDQGEPLPFIEFTPNFIVGADTFDLGAVLNPVSIDENVDVPFSTSASAFSVITIDGLGSDTLEIRWRANTLNDAFGGDGFLTDSSAFVLSAIEATITGIAPGTPVEITYNWDYFAAAVAIDEAVMDDPETTTGSSCGRLTGFHDESSWSRRRSMLIARSAGTSTAQSSIR